MHYPPLTRPLSHIYFAEAGGGALDEQSQKELEILFSSSLPYLTSWWSSGGLEIFSMGLPGIA